MGANGRRDAGDRRVAYVNARLLDPDSGLHAPGALLTEGGTIADLVSGLFADGVPDGIEAVDCGGHCLAPGPVDMRVQLREPGQEHKETIASGSRAAAAGGITALVCLPNTEPALDHVAVVAVIARTPRACHRAHIFPLRNIPPGPRGETR